MLTRRNFLRRALGAAAAAIAAPALPKAVARAAPLIPPPPGWPTIQLRVNELQGWTVVSRHLLEDGVSIRARPRLDPPESLDAVLRELTARSATIPLRRSA